MFIRRNQVLDCFSGRFGIFDLRSGAGTDIATDIDHEDFISHADLGLVHVVQHLFGTFCPNLVITRVAKEPYPKCFTSAVRYDSNGSQPAQDFSPNDNLLIKGNNLLALASLQRTFAGQVKCIYIDPPYYFIDNKSGDTFGYNSNFKLSTWLVFMKNRLTIARELLSADGSIWISVGKDGQHYLKVLADDIFGTDCFVADISWQKTYSPRNDAHGISSEVESILVYSKSSNWKPNKLPRTEKMNSVYKNPDNDHTLWRTSDAFAPSAATHQGMVYAIQHPITGELIYPYSGACWPLEQTSMMSEMSNWADYQFVDIHDEERRAQVCGIPTESIRKNVKAIMLAEPLESAKAKSLAIISRGQWPKFFFTRNGYGGIARKTYLDDSRGKVVTNFWPFDEAGHTDEAKKEVVAIFDDKAFSTPKPERLIMQILQVATKEGDLVLDYHLGCGTTCAVAHQMKRRFIGIEQMDYIKSLCVERLKYTITGGETNISDAVNWQGGGSFVYCELMQLNAAYADRIQAASTEEELETIRKEIEATGFISCKVTVKQIDEHAVDFKELSVDDQKRFLMELLDKNLLYVNLCDMDDAEFGVSETDKAFTKSFYGRA